MSRESGEDGGGLRGGGGGQGWAWGRRAKVSGGAENTSTLGHAKDQSGKEGQDEEEGGGVVEIMRCSFKFRFFFSSPLQVQSLDFS